LKKIEELGVSLTGLGKKESELRPAEPTDGAVHLILRDLQHSFYHERDDRNFVLGPLDLDFSPGELVFLIGGNGSGKTTFAKLVSGLYEPEAGEIWMNGERVTKENRELYRQVFSVVSSAFYLFEQLLGLSSANLDSRAREYLSVLQLDHKVDVKDGLLSTTELSRGQRKRLALLTAYLEDRPVYIFDEWAADQDPIFKQIFYLQLLPELKARGKTTIVISHDDKYYDVADRIKKGPSVRWVASGATTSWPCSRI
jgi:putative pyoverdin transport system ATP-binding/permease protein